MNHMIFVLKSILRKYWSEEGLQMSCLFIQLSSEVNSDPLSTTGSKNWKSALPSSLHCRVSPHICIGLCLFWGSVKINKSTEISVSLPFFFFFFFFCLFRAASAAYEGWKFPGEGSNQNCNFRPQPQPRQIWAASTTSTTAHSNSRSLTHWERPGIEPSSSWILVGFSTLWATRNSLLFSKMLWKPFPLGWGARKGLLSPVCCAKLFSSWNKNACNDF